MEHKPSLQRKARTILLAAAAMALLAMTVFKVPLATILLIGLLLVCPLMMVGMHSGGQGHDR